MKSAGQSRKDSFLQALFGLQKRHSQLMQAALEKSAFFRR
ncbi:MAG: hypothetical protein JWM11_2793, partial [Planctomycetaceae bacterium]|nr:hypothetical protein [Planctomycetaceae bacterium]